jgi:MFS family permease
MRPANSGSDFSSDRQSNSNSVDPASPRRLSRLANTFSAFGVPAYRLIWLSQVSSTTGMQMQMFARGLLAYQLGGRAGAIGFVTLGQAIPQFLFSMVGGAIADRFERRRLMMVTQMLTAVTAIIVAVMVKAEMMTVPYLFVAGLVQGSIMSFGGPARQAFVPEVVGEKDLMNALALNNAAMNLSRIGAPSLAGALVAVSWIDLGGLYFIQAVLSVFSLVLLFALPHYARLQAKAADSAEAAPGRHESRRDQKARSGSMTRDFFDGLRYISSSPILVTLLLMGLVPTLLGQSYQQFLPVFAKNVFGDGIHRNAGALGLMGTMSGVGALMGALTVASLSSYKRRTQIQLASGLGFGLFLACFAIQSSYAAALFLLVGVGFMSSFFQSLNSTMVMSASDPAYYGRVMSVNMLTFSLTAFGTFGIGYLIDLIGHVSRGPLDLLGVQATFLGLGVIIMAFILAVTVFNPSYRRLEQSDLGERRTSPRPVSQAASGS